MPRHFNAIHGLFGASDRRFGQGDDGAANPLALSFRQVHLACELVYPGAFIWRLLDGKFRRAVDRTIRDGCLEAGPDRPGPGDVVSILWCDGVRDPEVYETIDLYARFARGLSADVRQILEKRSGRAGNRRWGSAGRYTVPDLDDAA